MFGMFDFIGGLTVAMCQQQADELPGIGDLQSSAAIRQNMAFERARGEESLRRFREYYSLPAKKPRSSTYDCAGCGAPLFGIVNENCQYCLRPGGGNN